VKFEGGKLAKIKSSLKADRVARRKQARNRPIRSAVRTYIAKAVRLVSSGELESAQEAVVRSIRALDKAAQKGVIHPNNAARRKSRLMKKLNRALASPKPRQTKARRAQTKVQNTAPPEADESQESAES
jgi:small subunit ribosomal protein S20